MAEQRITKAQRWIDLIACLHGRRRPMTSDEIFEAVPRYRLALEDEGSAHGSLQRMFERDKEELRELGIPIETRSFPVGLLDEAREGYVLSPDALYMPYVRVVEASEATDDPDSARGPPEFTPDDVELALEALREAADVPGWPLRDELRSAFRKLSFDLGEPPGDPALRYTEIPGASALAAKVRRLAEAWQNGWRVRFRYHGLARGEETDRDVAPYGLFMERGVWYLVGEDALRGEIRMFHVGRMDGVEFSGPTTKTPSFEIPADFSLADYRDRQAWEYGDEEAELSARVHFQHPLSSWAERNGFGTLVRSGDAGDAVRRFGVRHADPFLRWVLGFAGRARIIAPAVLADEARDVALGIARAHGDDANE